MNSIRFISKNRNKRSIPGLVNVRAFKERYVRFGEHKKNVLIILNFFFFIAINLKFCLSYIMKYNLAIAITGYNYRI